ncbi:MAG: SUMF1/EgtB/PvdO family nonheme iron enzyme, partial [Pyrinomonadaceae bacterium]
YFLFGRTSADPAKNNVNAGTTTRNESNASTPIERKPALIPGGSFMMGSNEVEDKLDDDWGNEFPAHPETVDSFNIDTYETTNAQYALFVASGHKAPSYWINGKPPEGQENHPVTNVSLVDAKAYAVWVSKRENKECRLPVEKEWEYAARNGAQATTFPWGGKDLADLARLKGRDAVPVGSTRDETQVGGVKEMMGNVSEWTSSPYALYKGHPSGKKFDGLFVVRGLNFKTPDKLFQKPHLMLMYRQYLAENKDYDFLGFRLVCSP